MTKKAPGKSHREGLTLAQMIQMFPSEDAATKWFESIVWGRGRFCPKCGNTDTKKVPNAKPMPYWCKPCRSYFSVRTNTPMARTNIPLQKWAIAIYLCTTSLKSISSMKLHRDIGVTQKTAWFVMQRIREAWNIENDDTFDGPVEIDETYFGGKRANKSLSERAKLTGHGAVDMTSVVGAKDRETNHVSVKVVESVNKPTIHKFVADNAELDATVYTDEHSAYEGIPQSHETVNHSAHEYIDGLAYINGLESFWSMLKRAQKGTFHKMSPKHLQCYVSEFAGKHNTLRVRHA